MSNHEQIGEYIQNSIYSDGEKDNKNLAGRIAGESIRQSISSGAGLCAVFGKSIWQRAAYVNPHTGEAGIVHQIIGGRPDTSWNKFYRTIIESPTPSTHRF